MHLPFPFIRSAAPLAIGLLAIQTLWAAEPVVQRAGWSFERSEFRETPAQVEGAKQKGAYMPLTGWTEYDLSVSKKGWYELWVGGMPPEWSLDLFLDGKNIIRLGTSSTKEDRETPATKGKADTKEVNLYLTEGKHTLRFRRLGFPGTLPSVWELRDAAGDPAGCIQAGVTGSPLIEPGSKVTLHVVAGTSKPVRYELLLRNEMTQALTPSGVVEVPATEAPVERDIQVTVPEEGLYQVLAKVNDHLLRPSDLKAGYLLAVKRDAESARPSAQADKLQLASLFTSGAVLQRDKPLPIWGWAKAGEVVSVSLAGQTEKATAGQDGRWQVVLKPLPAGGPHALKVEGSSQLVCNDIMIGEVWLLSGQSNTGGMVVTCPGGKEVAEQANSPEVRSMLLFAQPGIVDGVRRLAPSGWSKAQAGGDAAKFKWYAIPYAFGTALNRELGVPVGIILAGRGGTFISTWTSLATHQSNPSLKAILEAYAQDDREGVATRLLLIKTADEIAKWRTASEKATAQGTAAPEPLKFKTVPQESNRPGLNFDQLITPAAPYAIRGVLWYQGENDSGMAEAYKQRLPAMFRDWRNLWHDDSLPFVYAQIAYGDGKPHQGAPGDSPNAELREAQFQTASSPHTAMIVTHDLVTPSDNVHYLDKLPVGQRMALAALGTVYGKSIEYSGPVYRHVEFKGGKARITFDHVGGGLMAHGDKLGGFALAGTDRKWVWADAHIESDSVIVESPAVPSPVAVRYAWTDTPCGANLFNKAGLPASGFRTDNWPLTTKGIWWVQKN